MDSHGLAEIAKPNRLVGCVGARDQLALHSVPGRRCLKRVAPVDEVAEDEADVAQEITESKVVEGGGVTGVGRKHDGEAVEPVHVLKVHAHLAEHDRGRRVVGVRQTSRGRVFDVPEEINEDEQVRGLRRD